MQTATADFSFVLVAVSLVISAIGSFIAFHILRSAALNGTPTPWKSVALASVSMGGVGIWSMHFVGMTALRLPVLPGYSIAETVGSFFIAVIATAASFLVQMGNPRDPYRLALSAPLLGLGVCGMHYLGMHGMRFDGYIDWSMPIVLASLVLSVGGAAAALWLVFAARSPKAMRAAPVVMAAAVSGMHYIAMSAASFVCVSTTGSTTRAHGVVGANDLPSMVVVTLLAMVALLSLDQWLWADAEMSEEDAPANGPR